MPFQWLNPPDKGAACLRTITGCSAEVVSLAASQDGQQVLSKTADETIQLWNFKTGTELSKIESGKILQTKKQPAALIDFFTRTSKGLVVNQDLTTVFSVQEEGHVSAFDLSNGKRLFEIRAPDQIISALALTADSRQLISGSIDGRVSIWDCQTQKLLGSCAGHQLPVTCVSITFDGKRIYSGSFDKTVRVWDTEGRTELLCIGQDEIKGLLGSYNPLGSMAKRLQQIIGWVNALATTPDGGRIFIADGLSEEIKAWDGLTGRKMDSLKGHAGWINALAVSPDGRLLVSASNDGSIKLWDIADSSELATLMGHAGAVTAIAFSGDAKFIVSAGADCNIKIWDVYAALSKSTLEERDRYAHDVAFFPDGRRFVSVGEKVHIWESTSRKKMLTTPASGRPRAVKTSPDGTRLVWSNSDTLMELWEPQSGGKPLTLECYLGAITAMAISPDGERIVAGGDEFFLKVWDASSGRDVHLLRWYPEGKENAKTTEPPSPMDLLMKFLNSREGVACVAISPDSRLLLAGGRDSAIKIWDLQTGKLLATLTGHTGAVINLSVFPDGTSCVSAGEDGLIFVWDLRRFTKKELLANSKPRDGGAIESLAVAPDAQHLYWANSAGQVFRWNVAARKLSLLGDLGKRKSEVPVRSLAVTADAQYVVAGGASGELVVWQAETGQRIDLFQTQAAICCVEVVDQYVIALDETRRFYLLELAEIPAGQRYVTARKVQKQYVFRCSHCCKENQADATDLGKEAGCSGCGNRLKLNQFIAREYTKQWWRFW